MYEHRKQPLASRRTYYSRIGKNLLYVFLIMALMLGTGTIGYMNATRPHTEAIDAFHNAAMILSGMGPVITSGYTAGGKIFSSLYALFSGIIFITSIGFILAPTLHRIFHRMHLEE